MASGAATEARRRARAAEQRAAGAVTRARQATIGVSVDRDLEGGVAQCVADAEDAHRRCGEMVRKCDGAARVDPYADRFERREAARDAERYARLAEQAADAAELAADGAEWHARQIEAGNREVARIGADWLTTYHGWRRRR